MSYPALVSFFADPERTPARAAVYMAIQPPFLSHAVPHDVKIEAVRRVARVDMATASRALTWLIERGYLVVHSTDARGMRTITLAWALPDVRLSSGNQRTG